jgi:GNAT superfamily N-acetyltransferase
MTSRVLPVEEWPRLAGTELEAVWPTLDPGSAQIVVVEEAGQIVGCWALLAVWHVEGVWIHPDYRSRPAGVARRLLVAMRYLARRCGALAVLTGAIDPKVRHILTDHLHARPVPGEQFIWELGAPVNRHASSHRPSDRHGRICGNAADGPDPFEPQPE